MSDIRHKDANWGVGEKPDYDGAKLATLMDIRDELKELNRLFRCDNFLRIPREIERIRKNTTKPKKRKVKNDRRKRR